MANKCPICPEQFSSKAALQNHTGTRDASLCRAHTCPRCTRKSCSQRAMGQHRAWPCQAATFSCGVCKRSFAGKQEDEQHNKSSQHARMLARAKPTVGHVVGALLEPKNVPFYQTASPTRATPSTSIKQATPSDSDSRDEYSDDDDKDGDALTYAYSRAVWDDEQDWILCDNDCGWCGHCGDGVDY